jgi:hypothetical protein
LPPDFFALRGFRKDWHSAANRAVLGSFRARRAAPPEVTQRDDYRAAFEEMPDDSWKTM